MFNTEITNEKLIVLISRDGKIQMINKIGPQMIKNLDSFYTTALVKD